MGLTRERVFDDLLTALGAADPLEAVLRRGATLCRGAGLVVNELGEAIRSVGRAPNHLIADWVLAAEPGETQRTRIGRWTVRARMVRIRQRAHFLVIAVHAEVEDSEGGRPERSPASDGAPRGPLPADVDRSDDGQVGLVLETMAKILQAFAGFESFSVSTRREESARLMRDLEVGVSPGREPARWRALEAFGFEPYHPVRVVRARMAAEESAALGPSATEQGIIISDTGYTTSVIEHTGLCVEDFALDQRFAAGIIGLGISQPFTALSQVPEMLRSADVALAAAAPGAQVRVDEMRPVEWAAARMSSRFDHEIVEHFLDRLDSGTEAWSTLTTFVETGARVADAAARLQVHENTVRYRLGQIERALGGRLADPRTMADVVIALECRRLSRS